MINHIKENYKLYVLRENTSVIDSISMCFVMVRKSSLLNKFGNIVNENNNINVFDINFEILSSLNKKMINLEAKRNDSYDLHYMKEIVIIVFLTLLSNCDKYSDEI